jgi:hypothetical protein
MRHLFFRRGVVRFVFFVFFVFLVSRVFVGGAAS